MTLGESAAIKALLIESQASSERSKAGGVEKGKVSW